jgi:hypothetical protein
MHERSQRTAQTQSRTPGWAVYQCVNGCVHVRLSSVRLTFTHGEFAERARLIGDASVQLSGHAAVANVTSH